MIIGFLGKGGSGKSSVSTAFSKHLLKRGMRVLAIDADHNMDLAYNLRGSIDGMRYLGDALPDLLRHEGKEYSHYSDLLFAEEPPHFSLSSAFTQKYSSEVTEGLKVMAGGPHTENVMFGQSCSHVLTTPLKAYLPLLSLNDGEAVVIDEKAGSDGAGTGIATGMTLAIIVVEPTIPSAKAARQIAELLRFFDVPYEFVINKDKGGDIAGLEKEPLARIPFSEDIAAVGSGAFDAIAAVAHSIEAKNPRARFERSKRKFERNREFGQ